MSQIWHNVVRFFRGEDVSNSESARERLKVVLLKDRVKITPEAMQEIREELLEMINQYVQIASEEALEITLEKDGTGTALVATIPVKDGRAEIHSKEQKKKVLDAETERKEREEKERQERDSKQKNGNKKSTDNDVDEEKIDKQENEKLVTLDAKEVEKLRQSSEKQGTTAEKEKKALKSEDNGQKKELLDPTDGIKHVAKEQTRIQHVSDNARKKEEHLVERAKESIKGDG